MGWEWFSAPDYWLTRLVVQRALAAIYLIGFLVALNQFRPLLGDKGLLPVPRFLRASSFRESPSIFHVRYSDRLFVAVSSTGALLAAAAVLSLPERAPLSASMLVWLGLWALYL